jgi:hypothetical protein
MSENSSKKFVVFASLALLILVLVVGGLWVISKKGETTVEQEQITVEKEELQGEIVSGFPDIPVYARSELIYTYKKMENGKNGYEGVWKTDESVSVVMNWYIENLEQFGWNIIEPPDDLEADGEQYLVAVKGDLVLNLIVENEEGPTEIHAEFPLK